MFPDKALATRSGLSSVMPHGYPGEQAPAKGCIVTGQWVSPRRTHGLGFNLRSSVQSRSLLKRQRLIEARFQFIEYETQDPDIVDDSQDIVTLIVVGVAPVFVDSNIIWIDFESPIIV